MELKERVFRREEIMRELKISQRKADEIILSGELRSFKIGKRRLVSEAALAAFIKKQEAAAR